MRYLCCRLVQRRAPQILNKKACSPKPFLKALYYWLCTISCSPTSSLTHFHNNVVLNLFRSCNKNETLNICLLCFGFSVRLRNHQSLRLTQYSCSVFILGVNMTHISPTHYDHDKVSLTGGGKYQPWQRVAFGSSHEATARSQEEPNTSFWQRRKLWPTSGFIFISKTFTFGVFFFLLKRKKKQMVLSLEECRSRTWSGWIVWLINQFLISC